MNYLLILRNKKINIFDGANGIINRFAEEGYYFDKVAYVGYDKSDEIVRSIVEGKENYENFVIYCPSQMEITLKKFINSLFDAEFNELGILKSGIKSVFMLFSDRENRLLFDDIFKILIDKYNVNFKKAYIKTVGASAKEITQAIEYAINVDPYRAESVRKLIDFNVSDNFGDSTIEIVYSEEIPKNIFDKVFSSLFNALEKYVYSIENYSLAERLIQLLKLRRMKISVAESFTGGGIGKRLVEISGASEVYFEGLNTYSNEAKIQRLGVNETTLLHYGAVSEEVACQMSEGLIKNGNCDIAIATTGIAGPKSDNTNKPVGLAYISVSTREGTSVYKYNFKGNREQITNTAINYALFLAYKTLK